MLVDNDISRIAEGQTDVSYAANGVWVVRQQMKHAIKQALLLNDGFGITLPNGKKIVPKQAVETDADAEGVLTQS